LKRNESDKLKKKEPPKKAVCYGCGQVGHMAKDKKCPKNNKEKKKTTAQIYMGREDTDNEESEPYEGSQYSLEGQEIGFKDKSQDEKESVQMHMYRTTEIEEDLKE